MAKQKQVRMQMQVGALSAIPQLEQRTDEQLMSESKHRVAAKAILGARAAERYDVKASRGILQRALAGCHPQERPALRQMMKASLALAERRPDDLKAAMEKLGQEAPSSRQLLLLRLMGLVAPPSSAGMFARVRGILILLVAVIVLAGDRLRDRGAGGPSVRRDRHRQRRILRACSWSSWPSECSCSSGAGARRRRAPLAAAADDRALTTC